MARKIEVQIVGDASSLNRALSSVTSNAKVSFGTFVKGAVVFQGVQKAQELLSAAVRGGIDEWRQQTAVAAQTKAVLKSTGGVANVFAKDVDSLASSIMKKTGIDDEAVASGENLLLTFKNVRNEVGQGNAVFDRATQSAVDLSVAGFGSVSSASKMMGKALNDPVKGMTALSRAGVTFSAAQKDAIRSLVESGDVLGAQKLILKEVESQVGGSAEAYGETLPGQLNIAKETFRNFTGELVAKAIPVMQQMVGWLKDHWPEISAAFQGAWASIKPILVALGDLTASVVAVVRDNWGTIGPVVKGVVTVLQDGARIITDVLKIVAALLRGDWSAAWTAFKDIVVTTVHVIQTEVTTVFGLVQAVIGGTINAIVGFFTALPGRLLATLGALASKALAPFKQAFVAAKTAIGATVDGIAGFFRDLPGKIFGFAKSAGTSFVEGISAGLRPLSAALGRLVKAPLNAIIDAWNGLGVPSFDVSIPVPYGPDISFSTPSISLPDIPRLARGGIVRSPTLALIGERGPEAVVPLDRGSSGRAVAPVFQLQINAPVYGPGGARQLFEDFRVEARKFQQGNIDAGIPALT